MKAIHPHVLIYTKGEHTYLIGWCPDTWREAIRQAQRWAADGDLNLSWFDCALIRGRIMRQVQDLNSRRNSDARVIQKEG